jgi:hypothetical protein
MKWVLVFLISFNNNTENLTLWGFPKFAFDSESHCTKYIENYYERLQLKANIEYATTDQEYPILCIPEEVFWVAVGEPT